jgi:hypothetical protein
MTDPDPPVTDDEARDLWATFRSHTCNHCGGSHARACPRVRRMEWHENERLAAVEFWPPGRWSDDTIVWPEDLPPDPDA